MARRGRTKSYHTRILMPDNTERSMDHELTEEGHRDHIKYLEWKKSLGEISRYSVSLLSDKEAIRKNFVLIDFDHGHCQVITDPAEAVAAFEWASTQPMLQNAVLALFKLPFKGKPEPTVLATKSAGRSPRNWDRIRRLILGK